MHEFDFTPLNLPAGAGALRKELREFLNIELAGMSPVERARSWMGFDAEFSRKLGGRGWIGMTWPKRYGGHERSAIERYVVLEELLAAGAPVAAHWIADRQSGNLLLRYGSEAQREKYLRPITRGEMFFCIGMSEPNAGSDLAAVRTRAVKADGGWHINGSKIWTTYAHLSHVMIALVRTSTSEHRHEGLSQFLIELDRPGITIRPITDMSGESHFNEVFFKDLFVEDAQLIGEEGGGWKQVTAELSLERSGPERYLSSYRLFAALLDDAGAEPAQPLCDRIGELTAELWTLRQMSMSIAGQLAAGGDPALEAAIVKDLGAGFEQALPRVVQAAVDADAGEELGAVMEYLLCASPAFSLRGGTREILRGIIARGLGVR
jgi:alkylation response protein AidB-like acyl-CoA dehydrogenase